MYPNEEEARAEIPEDQQNLLNHLAFVIIRPDALARGYERSLIEDFAGLGLYIVAFKYQFVDERQMEEIYRYTQVKMIRNQMRPLWWMTRAMYKAGPALILLLSGSYPEEFASCAGFVGKLKGPPNPALTKPDQIRYRYRAMNVVLCIIHSSDDVAQTLREARVCFSRDELTKALAHVPETVSGAKPLPHRCLEESAERWFGTSRRQGSFFDVLTVVKLRTLAHLLGWNRFDLPVDTLRTLYQEMLAVTQRRLSYVEEAETMHVLLDRELTVLDAVRPVRVYEDTGGWVSRMKEGDRQLLLDTLRLMADHRHFDTLPFPEFKEVLRRNLVVFDDWERLVLESSFVFHGVQLKGYYLPNSQHAQ